MSMTGGPSFRSRKPRRLARGVWKGPSGEFEINVYETTVNLIALAEREGCTLLELRLARKSRSAFGVTDAISRDNDEAAQTLVRVLGGVLREIIRPDSSCATGP